MHDLVAKHTHAAIQFMHSSAKPLLKYLSTESDCECRQIDPGDGFGLYCNRSHMDTILEHTLGFV